MLTTLSFQTLEEVSNDMIIDDEEICDDVSTELNVTGRGIATGCLIFGGQIHRDRMRVIRIRSAPDDIGTKYEDPM